ncbi:MAG: preprotein translocase subunit YajC [Sideroxydans sp.]|nr:preprotein translocase subunit YajC [Sideroxydans sp.]
MFISSAYAQDAAPAQGGGMMQFLPLFILIAVFYLLILRPQQKRAKEQKAMLAALQKGDEIVSIGGLVGRVEKVGENHLSIQVADNVVVQIQRSAVQSVLPKGTIKSN